ncbi:zinc finger protein 2 homolog [Drosophila sechellia]|uniref:zinc finger protein 2 homolog n=1 Tax=Drosophila sechellia TaxID=7238 RepID=UPI0013DE7023|nr:zinc finger protein 2 homolog [Drosophila sechellia]
MEDICRVCLGSRDGMVNIFEGTPGLGPSIPVMIAQWSGYEVVKGDSLPELICPSCLEDAHIEFYKQQTSKIGHQFLSQVKVEDTEEDSQYEFWKVSNYATGKSNSSQKIDCPDNLKEEDSYLTDERNGHQFHHLQKFSETVQSDDYFKDDENSEISVGENFQSDSDIREDKPTAPDLSNCHIQEDNFGDEVTSEDEIDKADGELKCVVKTDDSEPCIPKTFLLRDDNHERPHNCFQCGKSFARYCSYKNHLRTHAKEDIDSPTDHNQHIDTFQKTKKPQDQNRSPSKRHDRVKSAGRKYTCTYCPKFLLGKSALAKHLRVHTGERPYKCSLCPKAYKQNIDLKRHIVSHTTRKQFKCNLCESTFFSNTTYELHMRKHEGVVPYKCDICQRVFKFYTDLKIHIQSHNDELPYSCSRCSRAYKKSNDLRIHLLTHDQDAQTDIKVRNFKEVKCTHCHKKFANKHRLQVHTRIHTGVEPYRCDICKKTFKYATSLKVHTITHTGKRPFECDYCSKAFGQQIDLYRHIRIHTRERPHKCNQCESAFMRHSRLKAHLLVHSEERPHKCTQCQKRFKVSSSLSRHMRTHTGEKPYKCDHCPKAFADARTLRNHIQNHLGK